MINSSYFRRFGACAIVLTALGLASCSSDGKKSAPVVAQTIVVVPENNTESRLLTEIYAQSLEKGGFRVARKDPVADLAAGYAALKSGAADLFITHTGELLTYLATNEPAAASTSTTAAPTTTTTILEATSTTGLTDTTDSTDSTGTTDSTNSTDSTDTSTDSSTDDTSDIPADATSTTGVLPTEPVITPGQAAAESINGQSNLIGQILPANLQVGAASDAEDKSVIVCNAAVATTGSLVGLSDLARAADVLTLAAPKTFKTDKPFGLPGFEEIYGDVTFKEIQDVDPATIGDVITSPTTTIDTSVSTTIAETTTTIEPTTVDPLAPTTEPAPTTTTTIPADLLPDADCVAANSLDITLPNDAVIMDDDKNWIGTNGVIPVLTATAFTPGVSQLIDQISQQLTTTELRVMLAAIAKEPTSPEAMASRYIASKASTGS
jgi:glycine betaine/choline ABC-type transport system substrate-binding protein